MFITTKLIAYTTDCKRSLCYLSYTTQIIDRIAFRESFTDKMYLHIFIIYDLNNCNYCLLLNYYCNPCNSDISVLYVDVRIPVLDCKPDLSFRLQDPTMTLYHFANCLALAYTPYYLTYRFTGLAEYGAFWKVRTHKFIYFRDFNKSETTVADFSSNLII